MPQTWQEKRNPPLIKPWENLCGLCQMRWPKDDMVEQRGVLICRRPGCLDEVDPKGDDL